MKYNTRISPNYEKGDLLSSLVFYAKDRVDFGVGFTEHTDLRISAGKKKRSHEVLSQCYGPTIRRSQTLHFFIGIDAGKGNV